MFFGRFIAPLRILAGPLAGALRMRYPYFLAANASGAICWAGGTTAVVYFLGLAAEKWLSRFSWVALVVGLLVGIGGDRAAQGPHSCPHRAVGSRTRLGNPATRQMIRSPKDQAPKNQAPKNQASVTPAERIWSSAARVLPGATPAVRSTQHPGLETVGHRVLSGGSTQ